MQEDTDAPGRDPGRCGEAEELLELHLEDGRADGVVTEGKVTTGGYGERLGRVLVEEAQGTRAQTGLQERLERRLAKLGEPATAGDEIGKELDEHRVVEGWQVELGHRTPEEGDALAKARDAGARLESAGKVGAGSLEKEACRLAVERRGDLLLLQNEVVVDDALPGDHALGSGLPRSDGLRPDPLARQLVEPLALHGAGEANPVGTRGRG